MDKMRKSRAGTTDKPSRAHTTLWRKLKRSNVMGASFFEHVTLNTYIVDFFCKECGLVILIDEQGQNVDPMRDEQLLALGFVVLHLDAQMITSRPATVAEQIREMIVSMKSAS